MRLASVLLILGLWACGDPPAEESPPAAAADTALPFEMPDSTETTARAEAWLREGRLVEVRERLFTAPQLDSLEREAPAAAGLDVRPETLRLLVGEAFPLGELRIALTGETEEAGAAADTTPADTLPGDALPVRLSVRGGAATIVGATLQAQAAGDAALLVGPAVGGGVPDTVRVRVRGEP